MSYIKPSNRRWVIVITMLIAVICNYLDRQLLSILKPEILDHFNIGNMEYAFVVNVFLVAYAIMYPISGRLVDKFGPKYVMLGGIFIWSVACIGAGSCSSSQFWLFVICRACLGLAEPTIFTGQMVVVTMWFEKKDRATPNTICQAGGSLGAVVAPLIIGCLMDVLDNWQHVFYIAGFIGVVIAIFWFFIYKNPPKPVLEQTLLANEDSEISKKKTLTLGQLFKTKSLWGGILVRVISDPVWYFCCFWLPGFIRTLGENEGLNYVETLDFVQWFGGIPYLVGAVGAFCLALLCDKMITKGANANNARKRILICTAFGGPFCMLIPFVQIFDLPLEVLIGLIIAIFSIIAITCLTWLFNAMLLVTEQFAIKNVASVLGICCGAGALGSVVFNQFTGLIPEEGWTILFICMGTFHLIAAFVLHILVGRKKKNNI